MIIDSSNISFGVEHRKSESVSIDFESQMTGDTPFQFSGIFANATAAAIEHASRGDINGYHDFINAPARPADIELPNGQRLVAVSFDAPPEEAGQANSRGEALDSIGRTRARLWDSLLDAINPRFTGLTYVDPPEEAIFSTLSEDEQSADSGDNTDGVDGAAGGNANGEGSDNSEGEDESSEWGYPLTRKLTFNFKFTETIEEYESTSFNSTGKVTTADGKEIEFDLSLGMERSYSATREVEYSESIEFTDPLILNFGGNYADLSDEKFEFDLDADGDKELISYLSGDSGLLALDLNEDGIINDGTELFGALSGNGFADLAAYDEDGNNFIDEGDSIFDDLLIWRKSEELDELTSLQDNGIGAIYLGSAETPFDIKGEDNQTNGRVRSSGIYLTEAGDVGTAQQIDMAV